MFIFPQQQYDKYQQVNQPPVLHGSGLTFPSVPEKHHLTPPRGAVLQRLPWRQAVMHAFLSLSLSLLNVVLGRIIFPLPVKLNSKVQNLHKKHVPVLKAILNQLKWNEWGLGIMFFSPLNPPHPEPWDLLEKNKKKTILVLSILFFESLG